MSNLSLMAVFAHPDDESFGPAPTLVKYAHHGMKTFLLCATRGEGGKVGGKEATVTPEELGEIRVKELQCAAEALRLTEYRILGYPDGGLHSIDFHELTSKIVAAIRELKPDVLITFGPDGITGHPDHILVGKATQEAFKAAGDSAKFAEGPYGNLKPHWPAKLYFYAVPLSMVKNLGLNFTGTEDSLITTEIDVSGYQEIRSKAIRCHQTQLTPPIKKQDKLLNNLRGKYRSVNYFRLAASPVPPPALPEKDLFAGLE